MLVHLVVNRTAGAGRAGGDVTEVERLVARLGHHVERVEAPDVVSLASAVEGRVAAGAERIVVAGGDGLVHHLLPALAGTDVVVGIVPLGTGNDFARGVGLPRRLPAAVERALGPWRPVDAMRVGERWAASVATAGLSAAVTSRANALRRPRGSLRYTAATLLELPRMRGFDLTVRVDDDVVDGPCSLVAVANTAHFGGGMAICPDARPDDGVLDVTVVAGVTPATMARFFPLVFAGRHLRHPAVRTLRGRSVELRAEGVELWADGEPLGRLPATVTCVPGALRLAGW